MNSVGLDERQGQILQLAASIMAAYRQAFGHELAGSSLAEVYAARCLGLELAPRVNHPGYDARDPRSGERYQIKMRTPSTQNVEVKNFQFDFLVLVNLDAAYRPAGLWLITRAQAEANFKRKPHTPLFQLSQNDIKRIGRRLDE